MQDGQYKQALRLCHLLIHELAKIDDKALTMEAHVIEARIYKDLEDITKAKVFVKSEFNLTFQSALTACKMAASTIYVDAATQADIDLLSGEIYVLFT